MEIAWPEGTGAATSLYGALLAVLLAVTLAGTASAAPLMADSVDAGGKYTCAIQQGTGQPVCWGDNQQGQLGDATTIERHNPGRVHGVSSAGSVSAGMKHTCATGTSVLPGGSGTPGTATGCWGSNVFSPNDGSTTLNHLVPKLIPGLGFTGLVSAGNDYTCALANTAHSPVCWGRNGSGQLGDGTVGYMEDAPVRVESLNRGMDISAGWQSHTCAIRVPSSNPAATTGEVFCWGSNDYGQLGDGSTIESWTRVPVSGLGDATAITAGQGHSCAIRESGQAVCWGDQSSSGLLGNNSTADSPVPVDVTGLNDAVSISAGPNHTCAVRQSGQAVCWGWNGAGALGNPAYPTHSRVPVDVVGLNDAVSISAGLDHTCAIRQSGQVVCWGTNDHGQLGDGTVIDRGVPGPVDGMVDRYVLTVSRSGPGTGSVHTVLWGPDAGWCDGNAPCTEEFADGATVALKAVAAEGSVFTGWSGDCSGTGDTCEVTMDRARSVTAKFGKAKPPVPPKPPNENTAVYDPETGRLAIRLRCGPQYRPTCNRMVAQAVTGRRKRAKKMSNRRAVRNLRADRWRLTTLTIKPRFRGKVENMGTIDRKTLWVRIKVTARVKKKVKVRRNGMVKRVRRKVKIRRTVHHRYIVRVAG